MWQYCVYAFNLIWNTLRSFFESKPDLRYRLTFEDGLVKNEIDTGKAIFPLQIKEGFSIRITQNQTKYSPFACSKFLNSSVKKKGQILYGLPIRAETDITISIYDDLEDDLHKSKIFTTGQYIEYHNWCPEIFPTLT